MTNCAFTIVAKNYIGLAMILEKSIKRYYTDLDFFIVVADEPSSELSDMPENIIFAKDELGIDNKKWYEMAFKYDLTEFCTAIKPDSILYILSQGYEKVIYLDPDIYFFSSIAPIFESLDRYQVILTPHITTIPRLGETDSPENIWLSCGIFNLGFMGVQDNPKVRKMLRWWSERLRDQCFVEFEKGEYTDQKWMNFIPSFFDSTELLISNNLGCNLAPWNFFERRIMMNGDAAFVTLRENNGSNEVFPLIFTHFSGYDYSKLKDGIIFQKNIADIREYKDINLILNVYADAIRSNQELFDVTIKSEYSYNRFDNNIPIEQYHRRLYRAYSENIQSSISPFDIKSQFYTLLKNNRLLNVRRDSNVRIQKTDVPKVGHKVRIINAGFRMLHRLIGTSQYFLFLRFLRGYSRTEDQLHILGYKSKFENLRKH